MVRKDRSLSPMVSAALLALAVTLCTGSLADGATARWLYVAGQEQRATVTGRAGQNGEAMAALLSCLTRVATPWHVTAQAATAMRPVANTIELYVAAWWPVERFSPPKSGVILSLLNLPPPVAR